MRYLVLLITLLGLFFFKSAAQKIFKDSLVIKANYHVNRNNLDSAIFFYRQAAENFRKSDETINYLNASNFTVRFLSQNGQYKDAQELSGVIASILNNEKIDDDTLKSNFLYNKGFIFYNLSSYDSAKKYFHLALDKKLSFRDSAHWEVEEIFYGLGRLFKRTNQFDSAIICYSEAQRLQEILYGSNSRKVAGTFLAIGNIHLNQSNLPKAQEFALKALEIQKPLDVFEISLTYNTLAIVNSYLGDLDKGIEFLEKSLEVQKRFRRPGHPAFARVYFNLGISYAKKGESQISLDYLKKALSNTLENKGDNNLEAALRYQGVGNIFLQMSEIDSAQSYYYKSLRIVQSLFDGNHLLAGDIYAYYGEINEKKGELKLAEEWVKRSIELFDRLIGPENISSAESYFQLGNISKKKKEYNEAIEYYSISLDIAQKNHTQRLAIKNKLGLSEVYALLKEFGEAKKLTLEAYELNNFGPLVDRNTSILDGREGVNFYDNLILLETLERRAIVVQMESKSDGGLVEQSAALEQYLKCIELTRIISRQYLRDQDKIDFRESTTRIHNEALKIAMRLNEKDDTYQENVFKIIESYKAAVLSDIVAERDALKNFIPEDLLSKEKEIKNSIELYKSRMLATDDEQELSKYQNELFNYQRTQDSLLIIFKDYYTNYFDLVSILNIQRSLGHSQALIEFAQIDSSLVSIIVHGEKIEIIKIEANNIVDKVKLLGSISIDNETFQDSAFSHTHREVSEELLTPILQNLDKSVSELTIIPDGPLWNVNFDLLLTEEPQSEDPRQLPYLFKKYAISYAYSASLLFQKENAKNKAKRSLLAFSFGDEDASESGQQVALRTLRTSDEDLPGSRREVKAISELVNGDYYFGKYASEKQFKETAGDYQVLHLAIHGEVDDKESENSKLNFYAEGDSLEDGQLHVFEIYNMELNADLAVLSACETGTGEIVRGEGVMSLGRAFAYAGVNSLLLTRWEVSDTYTPEIMATFYRELKKGKRKSEALRQAKLEFLETADNITADPFYWSSFYVLGDDSPIEFKDGNNYWLYALALVSIVTLLFLVRRKFNF